MIPTLVREWPGDIASHFSPNIAKSRLDILRQHQAGVHPPTPALLKQQPGSPNLRGRQAFGILSTLFSADLKPAASATRIRAGAYTFIRVRTRTLGQILHTADNMAQVNSIMRAVPPNILSSFLQQKLDIYECGKNGAVLVLPEGVDLEEDREPNEFGAQEDGFEMRIRCGSHANVADAFTDSQSRTIDFRYDNNNEPFFAQQDNNWSDVNPWVRWDGVIAQRRTTDGRYQFSGKMKRLFSLVYIRPPLGNPAEMLQLGVLNHAVNNQNPQRMVKWTEWMLCVQLSGFSQGLNASVTPWRKRED